MDKKLWADAKPIMLSSAHQPMSKIVNAPDAIVLNSSQLGCHSIAVEGGLPLKIYTNGPVLTITDTFGAGHRYKIMDVQTDEVTGLPIYLLHQVGYNPEQEAADSRNRSIMERYMAGEFDGPSSGGAITADEIMTGQMSAAPDVEDVEVLYGEDDTIEPLETIEVFYEKGSAIFEHIEEAEVDEQGDLWLLSYGDVITFVRGGWTHWTATPEYEPGEQV